MYVQKEMLTFDINVLLIYTHIVAYMCMVSYWQNTNLPLMDESRSFSKQSSTQ